jgi:sulfate adenylyltransferase subunit 1 (EFTu-like GTPase family)
VKEVIVGYTRWIWLIIQKKYIINVKSDFEALECHHQRKQNVSHIPLMNRANVLEQNGGDAMPWYKGQTILGTPE